MLDLLLVRGTLDILVLRALSWGPAHGYAVSRWIRQTTGDALQIEEGALYPALRRLEQRRLLESRWQRTDTGREARVYHITPAGKRKLTASIASWNQYVSAMAQVLAARPIGGIG